MSETNLAANSQTNLESRVATVSNKYLDQEIDAIHAKVSSLLEQNGIDSNCILAGDIRVETILYLTYWNHRLVNNKEEQARIQTHLSEYIGESAPDRERVVEAVLSDPDIKQSCKRYAQNLLVPIKTVDLVVIEAHKDSDPSVLCLERNYYPHGVALPGGLIKESDEANTLGLPATVFAALRIGAEKILKVGEKARYSSESDDLGRKRYIVKGESEEPALIIHAEDGGGYRYRENIRNVLRPSDPRHIVDTTGFRCEIVGSVHGLEFRKKSEIMSPSLRAGGFAFEHHREIVSYITAQTSVEKERDLKERDFVRGLIDNPRTAHAKLQARFQDNKFPLHASFPELFPVVDKLLSLCFTKEINEACERTPLLAGIRDKAIISLRQVCLKNRTFCPYLPTMQAIAQGIAFLDVVARDERNFYDNMPKDKIVEHNPKSTPDASYHMYRYKYRLDDLTSRIPDEIVIPTFEPLSAIDLMRVRGVPIRFVGLSPKFLYVDEFEQSPEEFYMHDVNHSWRMMKEDIAYMKAHNLSKDEYIQRSCDFMESYLDKLKILETDTQEVAELKKLKTMILFEIVHEDARPILQDVICEYIQIKEGGDVPFEVPRIDPYTGYMDVVDTIDTGISTLAYVRSKLQHGFYDHIDAQEAHIVSPKYRSAEWIAKAAYDMLVELNAKPSKDAEIDESGHVSYEWLLKRTCSVGPDNIHKPEEVDPAVATFGDGARALNQKRYQAGDATS